MAVRHARESDILQACLVSPLSPTKSVNGSRTTSSITAVLGAVGPNTPRRSNFITSIPRPSCSTSDSRAPLDPGTHSSLRSRSARCSVFGAIASRPLHLGRRINRSSEPDSGNLNLARIVTDSGGFRISTRLLSSPSWRLSTVLENHLPGDVRLIDVHGFVVDHRMATAIGAFTVANSTCSWPLGSGRVGPEVITAPAVPALLPDAEHFAPVAEVGRLTHRG